MATISAVAGLTVTVNNSPFYSQLLREGQKIAVYDTTLATKRTNEAEITKIDFPGNVVTLDLLPTGTIVGDKILPEGLSGANPTWYFGLQYHHSDAATGTWLGFNRANEPAIRASRVNAGSNSLTTPPIRLALNKILQRVNQVNPKSLLAHLHSSQKAAYEELAVLISQIQKGSSNEPVDLLFGDVRLAGVPAQVDIHAARDRIDFLSLDTWGRVESAPVDFLKMPDGRYFDRPIDTTTGSQIAAVIFWVRWFGQFFIDNPAAVSYISDLAIPSGYTAI